MPDRGAGWARLTIMELWCRLWGFYGRSVTHHNSMIGEAALGRLVDLAGPSRITAAGNVVLVADESRSQAANRQACLDRLREMIIAARKRPRKRKATRPTAGSRERRLQGKRRRSQIKRGRRTPSADD